MRTAGKFLIWATLLLYCCSIEAAEQGKLLSTSSLANQVRSLGKILSDSPGTSMETKRAAGLVLRDRISQFVVDQIQAKPDITKEQLLGQLRVILCSAEYGMCGITSQPALLTNGWFGPKGKLQLPVGYQLGLGFMGPQGMITVLESFVVQDGKVAQHGAPGGSEFDAYAANFELIQQFVNPSEIWISAWGSVLGGNGRGISGRATLYRVGIDDIKVAWDDAREVNVSAQKSLVGWEFMYADKDLLYGNDPRAYFFDVYKIDFPGRTFSQVVHFRFAD